MNTIRTNRLVLIPQTQEHAKEMFRVLSDPRIYEFENEPPASEEQLRERFRKLETRESRDGQEKWLNWVVQIETGELVGYVQATILPDQTAFVAYEFHGDHWRKGYGSEAVSGLISELQTQYAVQLAMAVFKKANFRSRGLLAHLGFEIPTEGIVKLAEPEEDEDVLALNLI